MLNPFRVRELIISIFSWVLPMAIVVEPFHGSLMIVFIVVHGFHPWLLLLNHFTVL
jgi:hypothetical protein